MTDFAGIVDKDAEAEVLAACLLNPDVVPDVAARLASRDFYDGRHKSVFEAVVAVADTQPVDPVLIGDWLEDRGRLLEVGGPAFIAELTNRLGLRGSVNYHVGRVADKAHRRRLVEVADAVRRDAHDPAIATADVAASLEAAGSVSAGEYRLWSVTELDQLPQAEWLVDGVLPDRAVTVVYGPWEAGKSLVCVDWALSIGAGRRWFGRDTSRGPVLYVAGEGEYGIAPRVRAWSADRQGDVSGFRLGERVDMLDRTDEAKVTRAAERMGARLVVVDTVAANMAGDENDTETMARFANACRRITDRAECAVVAVHHAGYGDGSRMRGSSALAAAVDAVIRCEQSDAGQIVVSQPPPPGGKAKDAPRFRPWHLNIKPVGESVVLSLAQVQRSRSAPPDPLGEVA